MSYKVLATKEFSKDFRKVDKPNQDRIKEKLKEIAEDPARYKKLHYGLSGSSRIWVGKLRIIFSYDQNKEEIYLEKMVFRHKY